MAPFQVVSDFEPAGDQPAGHRARWPRASTRGDRFQTLLGITGSGKSATIAWTIEQVQRPTLVLAPNKALAAQLANEFREFFPEQPGRVLRQLLRLLPARGLHRRRATPTSRRTARSTTRSTGCATRATSALLTRRDVIVVASVSLHLRPGLARGVPGQPARAAHRASTTTSAPSCARLVDMQYDRNDMNLVRGKFRVRGDTIEVHPAYDETAVRIELFGDDVERHHRRRPAHRRAGARARRGHGLPGHPLRRRRRAHAQRPSSGIEAELQERLA